MNTIGVLSLLVLLVGSIIIAGLTKRRGLRLTSFAMIALVLGVAGFFLWQAHRWEHGFAQIHPGDSRELVRKIMGAPTQVTDATVGIYGSQRSATDRTPGCTEQFWYYPFFTPECWWFAFDAKGNVLSTYHYISP